MLHALQHVIQIVSTPPPTILILAFSKIFLHDESQVTAALNGGTHGMQSNRLLRSVDEFEDALSSSGKIGVASNIDVVLSALLLCARRRASVILVYLVKG